jgi:predicted aminopeptidase
MVRRSSSFNGRGGRWRYAAALLVLGLVGALGCSSLGYYSLGYYSQAAWGQTKILAARRAIEKVALDPTTSPGLRARLETVLRIRDFASDHLGLPAGGSYGSYVELPPAEDGSRQRFVVWNVVAAPELAMEGVVWCFPVAGCVTYRGYFSEKRAHRFAERLSHEGYDVAVSGATAYSTLGFFKDPVLSTVIDYPDLDLAALLFHELAHQLVYVRDDTRFNESFASAVESLGVRRYLAATPASGGEAELAAYLAARRREDQFTALVLAWRDRLEQTYAQDDTSDDDKRRDKTRLFDELKAAYQELRATWGGEHPGYDAWFDRPLNNAHLAAVGAYHDFVPGFEALLAENNGDLEAFYAAVRELAELDAVEREARLIVRVSL